MNNSCILKLIACKCYNFQEGFLLISSKLHRFCAWHFIEPSKYDSWDMTQLLVLNMCEKKVVLSEQVPLKTARSKFLSPQHSCHYILLYPPNQFHYCANYVYCISSHWLYWYAEVKSCKNSSYRKRDLKATQHLSKLDSHWVPATPECYSHYAVVWSTNISGFSNKNQFENLIFVPFIAQAFKLPCKNINKKNLESINLFWFLLKR